MLAGRKIHAHDFQMLVLEKCDGRRLLKLVAQWQYARNFS
jgi:hypothetical protein